MGKFLAWMNGGWLTDNLKHFTPEHIQFIATVEYWMTSICTLWCLPFCQLCPICDQEVPRHNVAAHVRHYHLEKVKHGV